MAPSPESLIERLAAEALRLGAEELEVEYKDSHEEVFAAKQGLGFGIARFERSSPEAAAFRKELYGMRKKKRRIVVDGIYYELRTSVYDSFGEDAFRVTMRRVSG